jgi:hypothetical protein
MGYRPRYYYKGMEFDGMDKAEVYEFPNGDKDAPASCLEDHHRKMYDQRTPNQKGR